MKRRPLGNTGIEVTQLGFGAMRLPDDEEKAAQVVRSALDAGINYFDTAPSYCNNTSEQKVRLGLDDRREEAYISTKNWIGKDPSGDNFREKLEGSLERLGTSYIDFYQMWMLGWDQFNEVVRAPGGPLEAAEKARDEGLIRHLCFSSHDTSDNIIRLIDTGLFRCMTVHYHILNRNQAPAMRHAREKGMGVVIMTPLAGGILAGPSERIASLAPDRSGANAEIALRFVLANRDVSTAISGMSSVNEVAQNVATASDEIQLAGEELSRIDQILTQFEGLGEEFCTICGYCMPCPEEVNIPEVFRFANYAKVYGLHETARQRYMQLGTKNPFLPGERASACTECGECEPKCPNQIPIIEQLKEARELFEGPAE